MSRDMQEAIDWYREWDESEKQEPENDGGPLPGAVKTLQGKNLWPERPEKLKNVYQAYIERVKKVGEALVHAMGVALDLGPPQANSDTNASSSDHEDEEDEEIFLRNCADSFWVMRMIGYPLSHLPFPPLPSSTTEADISQFSCGAHTDYGCVTLLLTDSTPSSLQVQLTDPTTNTTTWLNADPLPGPSSSTSAT
ncbi:hypothetical protein N0V83_004817 [Neocucurbitaria cava]|uniref:Clavaminate synthase-like protein n=1 Tax=Neocucurbitaria cava TaxID=798079 RepID=A0A9W9CNI9_9PLEO|nr:hypothetical protein N0V83_004817 [Neocucurbitaria cava]